MSASSPWVTCGTLSQERCRCGPESRLMRGSGLVSTGPNFAKSTAGISGMPMPAAAAGAAGAAAGPRRKPFTSSAVTRPFSPVPLSFVRSTPSSRASRRTEGLACTPVKSVEAAGAASRATGEPGWGAGGGAACLGCGAGSCCAITEGGGAIAPSSVPRSIRIGVPSPTRSPTLTSSFSTVPWRGAGTSIVALSLSSVTSGSSALIAAPSATWTSMTGTSLKSPMSGTRTSMPAAATSNAATAPSIRYGATPRDRGPMCRAGGGRRRVARSCSRGAAAPAPPLAVRRVGLLRVDAELADRVRGHGSLDLAVLRQRLQRRERHEAAVHLEELAQLAPVVGPAEPVRAEHLVTAGHEGPDPVGERLHVVRRGEDGAFPPVQAPFDVALAPRPVGVEHVPALHVQAFAAQLGEARAAPDVGRDAVLLEQIGARDHLPQDGAAAQELHAQRRRLLAAAGSFGGPEQVHPLEDALLRALRHCGVLVVLVHQGDVVEDVLLLGEHSAQPVLDDDRHLVGVGRVVGDAVGDHRGEDVAVAVLVLEALAVQRGATGRGAEQEAARAHVAGGPGEVADPLEAEHRVVDVERDHRRVAAAVRRGPRDPGADRARLVQPFLEDLALLVLLVEHELVGVLGPVELADLAVDAELPEHALHAEGATLVGHDGHDALADALVAQQRVQDAHESHGGREGAALAAALELALEGGERRHFQRLRLRPARRQGAAERAAPLAQVVQLRAALLEAEEGDLLELLVGQRQAEAVAELLQVRLAHLLLLVGDVLALTGLAHAVALDGLGEDDGGLAPVRHRRGVSGVDLLRVVAAAGQGPDLVVRHAGDHGLQLGVLAEEVLPHVGAVLRLEVLVLAVDRLLHPLEEDAGRVARDQRVPAGPPDHLEDVPAGPAEDALQLLDDLAVAAHRPVEALQVAVDDEDQVVEPLPARHADGAQGLRLVRLAVAEEAPDLAPGGVGEAAALQVPQEARLVDRHQRAEAHGDGRELPEVGHQPGVRVGGDALAVDLLAEVQQLLLGQPPFEEGAGVEARRGVALHVHEVAAVLLGGAVPEVLEADVVERRRGLEAGDVAAEFRTLLVGAQHDGERVPTDVGADAVLDGAVAGVSRLALGRDGVEVGRRRRVRHRRAAAARAPEQLVEQEGGAVLALDLDHAFQGVEPFPRLGGVDVRLRAAHAGGSLPMVWPRSAGPRGRRRRLLGSPSACNRPGAISKPAPFLMRRLKVSRPSLRCLEIRNIGVTT